MRNAKIGLNLKALREEAGVSIGDLAQRAGVSKGYLSDMENGNADPTLRELELLAHELGCTLHDIINPHEHRGTDYKHEYGT